MFASYYEYWTTTRDDNSSLAIKDYNLPIYHQLVSNTAVVIQMPVIPLIQLIVEWSGIDQFTRFPSRKILNTVDPAWNVLEPSKPVYHHSLIYTVAYDSYLDFFFESVWLLYGVSPESYVPSDHISQNQLTGSLSFHTWGLIGTDPPVEQVSVTTLDAWWYRPIAFKLVGCSVGETYRSEIHQVRILKLSDQDSNPLESHTHKSTPIPIAPSRWDSRSDRSGDTPWLLRHLVRVDCQLPTTSRFLNISWSVRNSSTVDLAKIHR